MEDSEVKETGNAENPDGRLMLNMIVNWSPPPVNGGSAKKQ
jgi:hypothetical protein